MSLFRRFHRSQLSVLVATLMLLAMLLSGCGPSTGGFSAVRMNQKAQILMKYGEYEQAKEELIASFDQDYENAASHYWLGQCYESLGDVKNALWEYKMAVRFDPLLEVAQMDYIRLLEAAGQSDESVETADLFFTHKTDSARQLMRIGRDLLSEGLERQGVLAYEGAVRNEPDNVEPYIELAEYYFQKGDQETGDGYLVKAFEIDPIYPGLARRLGEHGMRTSTPQPKLFPRPSELEKELRQY